MLIQEILGPIARTAAKALPQAADTYKLRAIINNLKPLDRLDPLAARNELSILVGQLRRIEEEMPQVKEVIRFIESQQQTASPAQVLQMAVTMLRKITG
jgi:hypothetical protein